MTDKAIEEILTGLRMAVVQSLAPHPGAQRVALLPSVVRMLLATFSRTWRVRKARGTTIGTTIGKEMIPARKFARLRRQLEGLGKDPAP